MPLQHVDPQTPLTAGRVAGNGLQHPHHASQEASHVLQVWLQAEGCSSRAGEPPSHEVPSWALSRPDILLPFLTQKEKLKQKLDWMVQGSMLPPSKWDPHGPKTSTWLGPARPGQAERTAALGSPTLALQITLSRLHLYTLGPKVGAIHILGALG